MDLSYFAIDTKKQAEGVWMRIGGAEFELLLGRMSSQHYYDKLEEIRDPILKALPRGSVLSKEKADEIYNRSLAKAILLGWRGKFELNGKPIPPYSEELAFKILSTPELQPFRAAVVEHANQLNEFACGNFEEIEKNLLSSSTSTLP